MQIFKLLSLSAILLSMSSCGYALKNSNNRSLEKKGIKTVYLSPMVNNSFKAGVENTVYNQTLRRILMERNVKVVRNIDRADAIILGSIETALMARADTGSTRNLAPDVNQDTREDLLVATHYKAVLAAQFSLRQGKAIIWEAGFTRSKRFRSVVALGIQGATTALIDDSSFDQALTDLASIMASDMHESMFADF